MDLLSLHNAFPAYSHVRTEPLARHRPHSRKKKSSVLDLVVMALIDSEKAFQKRCEEMHDGLFEKLQGQNIGSFSTLAFALGSPQNPVSDDEFTKLADAVFETQSTADHPLKSPLKG